MEITEKKAGKSSQILPLFIGFIIVLLAVVNFYLILHGVFGRFTSDDLIPNIKTFQAFLRMIEKDHRESKTMFVFPAIPSPVAVTCGRELMKDVSPSLLIYDRTSNGYAPTLRIN